MGDRQVTAAMRRAAGVFGCPPAASDDEVEAVIVRAHAAGDLVWGQIQRLRAGESVEVEVVEVVEVSDPVEPDAVPAAAQAERERDCYVCGAGVLESSAAVVDADLSPRGWGVLCPECFARFERGELPELFAGGVPDGE